MPSAPENYAVRVVSMNKKNSKVAAGQLNNELKLDITLYHHYE